MSLHPEADSSEELDFQGRNYHFWFRSGLTQQLKALSELKPPLKSLDWK